MKKLVDQSKVKYSDVIVNKLQLNKSKQKVTLNKWQNSNCLV
jgi:hypothetical protein